MTSDVSRVWADELRDVHSWSVSITLDRRPLLSHGAGRRFSGASMIKTFVAELLVRRIAAGTLSWSSPCPVSVPMRAPGDGVLGSFELPTSLAVADAVHLMLALSDNTATNALVELLGGLSVVNDELAAAGYTSRIRRWVDSRRADPRADGWTAEPSLPTPAGLSVVVPSEHDRALRAVLGSNRAAAMLRAQSDRRSLARFLVPDADFAHKTGTAAGVRHDGGVLVGPAGQRLSITAFTDGDDRPESVDDPACVGLGRALARTVELLGWEHLLVR